MESTVVKSVSNNLVTLTAESGGIYVLAMHNDENRFDLEFMTKHDKIYSNGLRLDISVKVGHPYFRQYESLLHKLLTFRMPTVAAINGHAFAAGLMFALAHDYRVMRSDRGFLCMNEVDMPSPLTPGMTSIIATKVPHAVTFRNMILQAHRFSATDALKNFIVDEIAPTSADTITAANSLARKWSHKALAGIVYSELKTQMYVTTATDLRVCNLGFVERLAGDRVRKAKL
ncbi:hypothetical protein BSLG_002888 [Batrachochytrium salamandrivorans]|nr:hypothetical protein BSLG_002888 [Batrachochytrium salamandrivorans]